MHRAVTVVEKDRGIVMKNVDATVSGERGFAQMRNRRLLRDISVDEKDLSAKFFLLFGQGRTVGVVDICCDHRSPLAGESACDRTAQADRGAGDDRYFAL